MKAISLIQPWANMIASGKKTIETRTWSTQYRGDLLICASRYISGRNRPEDGPFGCALAIVELMACRPMTPSDEGAACCRCYPRAWAWLLCNVRRLRNPIPIRGQLGLFDVAPDMASAIANAIGTQRCRICGCTETDCRRCIEKTGEPCFWVEPDLCSACAVELSR